MFDDEKTGYGRPPADSRFKKGQSGNPRGRVKGSKNLATDICEELDETIPIREGDKVRKVTKQRVMVKSMAAKAIKGDTKATSLLLDRRERAEQAAGQRQEIRNTEEEDAIVERWLASLGIQP
jgi:hypothetical protein